MGYNRCRVDTDFSNTGMKIRDFTVPELDRFRELCNFTTDELYYFNLRAKDMSNVEIAIRMNVSEPQVSKLAKRVKSKIKRVI